MHCCDFSCGSIDSYKQPFSAAGSSRNCNIAVQLRREGTIAYDRISISYILVETIVFMTESLTNFLSQKGTDLFSNYENKSVPIVDFLCRK